CSNCKRPAANASRPMSSCAAGSQKSDDLVSDTLRESDTSFFPSRAVGSQKSDDWCLTPYGSQTPVPVRHRFSAMPPVPQCLTPAGCLTPVLRVLELQKAGGKRQPADVFVRGWQPEEIGRASCRETGEMRAVEESL